MEIVCDTSKNDLELKEMDLIILEFDKNDFILLLEKFL